MAEALQGADCGGDADEIVVGQIEALQRLQE